MPATRRPLVQNPGCAPIYKAELIKYSTKSAGTYVGIAWNNYDPHAE
jgi:hypothetical protein